MINKETNSSPFIALKDVSSKNEGKWLLQNINLTISKGERLVIMGETGSGKSTLLKVIAGLEMCDNGAVFVNDIKLKGPQDQLIPGNSGICYMNQHAALRNNYRVHEVLERDCAMSQEESVMLYRRMGISHLLNRWSDEVSGGEKQRILLASLLVSLPDILLLDEPFSNLDQINKTIIQLVLEDFMERHNMTVVLATHDPADVWKWSEKLLILQEGQIIDHGRPGDIYFNPKNEYVAGLLGEYQIISNSSPFHILLIDKEPKEEIIVRSSQFSCSPLKTAENTIEGRVEGLRIFDQYVILHVNIDNFILKIAAAANTDIRIGDLVYVTPNYGGAQLNNVNFKS